jgi:hypothetical protein
MARFQRGPSNDPCRNALLRELLSVQRRRFQAVPSTITITLLTVIADYRGDCRADRCADRHSTGAMRILSTCLLLTQ